MAKGDANAAKNLDTSPDLEVVEGETTVVSQDEISALLEKMAQQNEEAALGMEASPEEQTQDAAGENVSEMVGSSPVIGAPQEVDPVESALEDAVEAEADARVDEAAPEAEIGGSAPASPIESSAEATQDAEDDPMEATGPSFTMEDVLSAASSATGFSVSEIQAFEPVEGAEDEANESADTVQSQEANADENPETANSEAAPAEKIGSKGAASMSRKGGEHTSQDGAKSKLLPLAAVSNLAFIERIPRSALYGVAGLAMLGAAFFISSTNAKGVETKLTKRFVGIEDALSAQSETLERTNDRLAALDRALSQTDPSLNKKGGSSQSPMESPLEADNQSSHSETAEGGHGESEDARKAPDVHSASPTEHGPETGKGAENPAPSGHHIESDSHSESTESAAAGHAGEKSQEHGAAPGIAPSKETHASAKASGHDAELNKASGQFDPVAGVEGFRSARLIRKPAPRQESHGVSTHGTSHSISSKVKGHGVSHSKYNGAGHRASNGPKGSTIRVYLNGQAVSFGAQGALLRETHSATRGPAQGHSNGASYAASKPAGGHATSNSSHH